jgi:hypothetical protein
MKRHAGPGRSWRGRALAYAALCQRRPDLMEEADLEGPLMVDILSKDIMLDGMIRSTRQAARAARDGRLLLRAAMTALNARVLLAIERRLGDEGTPQEERQRLRAYLSTVYKGEGAPCRTEGADRRKERLEDTLRAAISHSDVHRLLLRVLGGGGPHLRVLEGEKGEVTGGARETREDEHA